jgi:hypothetical protein
MHEFIWARFFVPWAKKKENWGAFFAARNAAKNRAFRSNSSDLLMQILRDFRCNPLRGLGADRQVAWASSDFALAKSRPAPPRWRWHDMRNTGL